MKVVIFCGGFGTRIRDVSDELPKPMIPIGRLPILWHIMKYYATFGFNDFVLCLGYKGHVIKEFFTNYEVNTSDFTIHLGNNDKPIFHKKHGESGWSVTLVDTGLNTMTGARLNRVRKYVGDENFLLTYGDGVGNINLDRLVDFHERHGAALTVTGVRPSGRFGELDQCDGVVTQFNEKPQASSGLISGGYFVGSPRVFDYLSDDESLVFEREPMNMLVHNRQLRVYEHSGFWQPMDTMRDYKLLSELVESGRAPWIRW